MAAITRLGPVGFGIQPAGSFAGKELGLLALGIATGSPGVGVPAVSQLQFVGALSVATGAPVAGTATFGGFDNLDAVSIASGAPTVGFPALAVQVVPVHYEILPPNATGFERSLAYPQHRLMDIPVPLRDLWRWDTCPTELLPWLAWAMSVDLWDPHWPHEKKRAIIRDSFELHRRKGTLWCIERYLSFAGATLKKAIVPPNKAFPGRSMTPEERRAWLDRFPQIRIFRFRDRGTRTYGAFASGGAYKLSKTFLGDAAGKATFFPYQTDALARYGRRAFLWDKGPHFLASGLETPLRWIERTREERPGIATTYEQVLIPGSAVQSLFLGAFARGNHNRKDGRRFPVDSTASTRIVSLRRAQAYSTEVDVLRQAALRPSLEPIQAFPEHVAEHGASRRGVQIFGGMPGRWLDPATLQRKPIKGFLLGYLPETSAPFRLYDRLHLHDPKRLPDGRPPAIYAGYFRLGQPAFTAELAVEIRGKRTNYEFGRFVYGHLTVGDRTPLNLARKAVQRSKAHRDKVLLRTNLHRPVTTTDDITTSSGYQTGALILAA